MRSCRSGWMSWRGAEPPLGRRAARESGRLRPPTGPVHRRHRSVRHCGRSVVVCWAGWSRLSVVLGGGGLWIAAANAPPERCRRQPGGSRVAAGHPGHRCPPRPVGPWPSFRRLGVPYMGRAEGMLQTSATVPHEARVARALMGDAESVSAPRRVPVAGAVRSRPSPIQISERLEQARAARSRRQADETLRLTRELEEAGAGSRHADTEAVALRGRTPASPGRIRRKPAGLTLLSGVGFPSWPDRVVLRQHQVVPRSRRRAVHNGRQEAAPAVSGVPTTLRDPFRGAGVARQQAWAPSWAASPREWYDGGMLCRLRKTTPTRPASSSASSAARHAWCAWRQVGSLSTRRSR